jgi:hypothetical protein
MLLESQNSLQFVIYDFQFSGILRDHHTGVEFKANSGLTSDDLLTISGVARTTYMLRSYVAWCQMALEAAKTEGKPPSLISKIKKMISQGKKDHDNVSNLISY